MTKKGKIGSEKIDKKNNDLCIKYTLKKFLVFPKLFHCSIA